MMQSRINLVVLALAALVGPMPPSYAAASSQAVSMSFDVCLARIRSTSTQLGVAPINIAETTDVRMVRFVTSDGSVLITCSRPDGKMVVTKSD
jgi:hypothetical protein